MAIVPTAIGLERHISGQCLMQMNLLEDTGTLVEVGNLDNLYPDRVLGGWWSVSVKDKSATDSPVTPFPQVTFDISDGAIQQT
jgi:hypothetical protein